MKTSNVAPHGIHAEAITRGHVGRRAGSAGVRLTDESGTEIIGVTDIELIGLQAVDLEDGNAQIVSDGSDGSFTQDEADELYLTRAGDGEGHVITAYTAGATQDLDLAAANWHDVTLTEACTLSFSNPPGSGAGGIWTIILRGEFDVTWPAEVFWRDTDGSQTATPPTMSGEQNVVVVTTLDGGTSYGASLENGSGGASGSATRWEVLLTEDGSEPITTEDGLDWLYVEVPI